MKKQLAGVLLLLTGFFLGALMLGGSGSGILRDRPGISDPSRIQEIQGGDESQPATSRIEPVPADPVGRSTSRVESVPEQIAPEGRIENLPSSNQEEDSARIESIPEAEDSSDNEQAPDQSQAEESVQDSQGADEAPESADETGTMPEVQPQVESQTTTTTTVEPSTLQPTEKVVVQSVQPRVLGGTEPSKARKKHYASPKPRRAVPRYYSAVSSPVLVRKEQELKDLHKKVDQLLATQKQQAKTKKSASADWQEAELRQAKANLVSLQQEVELLKQNQNQPVVSSNPNPMTTTVEDVPTAGSDQNQQGEESMLTIVVTVLATLVVAGLIGGVVVYALRNTGAERPRTDGLYEAGCLDANLQAIERRPQGGTRHEYGGNLYLRDRRGNYLGTIHVKGE